jgi:hypothetical protein
LWCSTLNVEQLDALVNAIGYFIILSSIISVAAVLYGDFLIKYFNLEEKYPRLARFIQIRRKLQWYYLNYNLIIIVFFTVLLIWFNLKNILFI